MATVTLDFNQFGSTIDRPEDGERCYMMLKEADPANNEVIVKMQSVVSMTTSCAKQIFGRICMEIGEAAFEEHVILDVSDGVYVIIQMGLDEMIENAKRD